MRAHAPLFAVALSLFGASVQAPARAEDQGWVSAFSNLRMRPGFEDPRASLAERIELAHALGRYGAEGDAVATLRAALRADPPKALRDELLLALARRASAAANEELNELLSRGAPPPGLALALSAIGDPRAIDVLVRALGRDESAAVAEDGLLRVGARAASRLASALATRDTPNLALRAANVLAGLGPSAQAARPALERALVASDPALRAAAAAALGQLGDQRSARALQARLGDQPNVAQAALIALAHVATSAQAESLAQRLTRVPADQRALALRALAKADPQRATPLLAGALLSSDPRQRETALDVLQGDAPVASWTSLLATRVRSEHSAAAASALARIAAGRGLPALLAAARTDANGAAVATRALAIGLRRFAEQIDSEVRDAGLAALRALPSGERRLLLRALARDPSAKNEVSKALGATDPNERATAAAAAGMLGDASLADPVRDALLRERDPEAARRLCEAARTLAVQLPWSAFELWLENPETAPEAAALAASSLREQPPIALRSGLRAMLAPGRATRVRVGAALALGALHDESAWPALVAALDDPAARVRLAAVHALAAIDGTHAEQALRVHARIERDPLVRAAAIDGVGGTTVASAQPPAADQVLEVRVQTEATPAHERPLLDVLLEDGRWLRVRTLPQGELLIPDLPPGQADVRAVE